MGDLDLDLALDIVPEIEAVMLDSFLIAAAFAAASSPLSKAEK